MAVIIDNIARDDIQNRKMKDELSSSAPGYKDTFIYTFKKTYISGCFNLLLCSKIEHCSSLDGGSLSTSSSFCNKSPNLNNSVKLSDDVRSG